MNEELIPWSQCYKNTAPTGEIVIVDDDEDIRDILAASLAPEGLPVRTFEDGDSFLQFNGTNAPICVFLDVVMPKRSGLEVLKELRSRQFSAPIILISARDDAALIVEAMKNGAHDYIRKPFDHLAPALRVRNAVELWSSRARERRALEAPPIEGGEWLYLSPSERDAIALMRMMSSVRALASEVAANLPRQGHGPRRCEARTWCPS
jgi:two-component system response regulator FixJ